MGIKQAVWKMIMWKTMQKQLGYSDAELEQFKADPRNADVLAKAPELMSKTMVAEVVHSHGCASGHQVGDKFFFDGAGNLLTKLSPSRICVYALSAMSPLIYTATELVHAGADPNEMRFKRAGCVDVGLECGGWGRLVLEISVEDRKK